MFDPLCGGEQNTWLCPEGRAGFFLRGRGRPLKCPLVVEGCGLVAIRTRFEELVRVIEDVSAISVTEGTELIKLVNAGPFGKDPWRGKGVAWGKTEYTKHRNRLRNGLPGLGRRRKLVYTALFFEPDLILLVPGPTLD